MDTTDVAGSSPDAAPAASVTGDRPIQNVVGEFNRKFGQIEQKVDTLVTYLASQEAQKAQPQAASRKPSGQVGDEDLWSAAQRGDRLAFEEYQRRIAAREVERSSKIQKRENLISNQLGAIVNQYPVLNDSSHPLTQTVNMAYNLMLQNGYAPGKETLLDAAKTAITDRKDLVTEMNAQQVVAKEYARQRAAGQGSQMGASHRGDPMPGSRPQMRLSQDEFNLAKRMNVKDPVNAKVRFLQRQQDGRSSLGAVSAFIKDEDF